MPKNNLIKKNKKGPNGMGPSQLILNYNKCMNAKYLNVLVSKIYGYAAMAEWLTQLTDTQHPSGFVGSIPTSSVTNLNF